MSKLTVGQLEGLASEGYKISVASGSQLVQPGSVLQVLEVSNTTDQSTTSSSFIDLTNATLTVTPSSASSKILVQLFASVSSSTTNNNNMEFQFVRDATALFEPFGQRMLLTGSLIAHTAAGAFVDSPNTTSATTYKVQVKRGAISDTITVMNWQYLLWELAQ
jgi:hypothetical protein